MDITEYNWVPAEGGTRNEGRETRDRRRIVEEPGNLTQRYEVLQELGDCYASVGKYNEAQQCYEKAALLAPDEAAPYLGLGVVALNKDLTDDSEIAFRVARRLDPDCAKAYAGLAMIAQQRQDYAQAFELYMKSLEIDSDNFTALLGLFQVSCRMGSFAKVIYYLETYLDMHPADTSVMFSLAALYMKDDQLRRAEKILRDVLTLDPGNKDAADLLEEVEHNLARQEQMRI